MKRTKLWASLKRSLETIVPIGNIELNENMEFASPPAFLEYYLQDTPVVGQGPAASWRPSLPLRAARSLTEKSAPEFLAQRTAVPIHAVRRNIAHFVTQSMRGFLTLHD